MPKLTIEQAEEQGFTVDTCTYPHFGYKGSRFSPDEHVMVYTELEAELMKVVYGHHTLYTKADFTEEEISRGNKIAVMVLDGGLSICKKCGKYESELTGPCERKKNDA